MSARIVKTHAYPATRNASQAISTNRIRAQKRDKQTRNIQKPNNTKRPAATWQTGVLVKFGKSYGSIEFRLPNATDSAEAFLEFVDAAFSVHELGKAGEEGM